MPNIATLEYFERRLVELGCPPRPMREKVRELSDHYEDLKRAALEDGLPESQAEARAAERLGNPVMLAENIVAGLRQASWWGRHPVIGFCFLPPLSFMLMWFGCGAILLGPSLLLGLWLDRSYSLDHYMPSLLGSNVVPVGLTLDFASVAVLTAVFCWLARRSAMGMKWMLAVCGICLAVGLCMGFYVQPHSIGFTIFLVSSNWMKAGIPLAMAILTILWQRKKESRLAPIPSEIKKSRPAVLGGINFFRRLWVMPTYWVVTILAVSILAITLKGRAALADERLHEAELKSKIWPRERAATLEQLRARQVEDNSTAETMIDLKPYLNATLTDMTDGAAKAANNNLAQLPSGTHAFGGTLFDVEGKMQILDKVPSKLKQPFPSGVRGIVIGRKCARLHLLHGSSNLHEDNLNQKIARLVLHYEDGSSAEIGIVGGEHVLDWWGPIYNTDSGGERYTKAPGTELAWAGSNPWIEKRAPNLSLRLYRSTFANPHPELKVASVDYVSTLSGAGPFMVGLTVDSSKN